MSQKDMSGNNIRTGDVIKIVGKDGIDITAGFINAGLALEFALNNGMNRCFEAIPSWDAAVGTLMNCLSIL
jgi:hypothetical protein